MAYDQGKSVCARDRVGVYILARKLAVYADARVLFYKIFADDARMIRRAAADDVYSVERGNIFGRKLYAVEIDRAVALDARAYGIGKRARLFVYFFYHKVRIPAFFGLLDVPLDGVRLFCYRLAVGVVKRDFGGRYRGYLAVIEQHEFVRVFERGGYVACYEVFAVFAVDSDHERIILADRVNRVRRVSA